MEYAASDVLHLHELKAKLDVMIEREGRVDILKSINNFLNTRADLDRLGWRESDIFSHSG